MRRTFRQDPVTHELVEHVRDTTPDRRLGDASLWNDRGYVDQRHTDGTDISSRSKHKEFMRRTGLTTFDDFKGEFKQRQSERDAYHSGARPSVSRGDIERSIHQLKGR